MYLLKFIGRKTCRRDKDRSLFAVKPLLCLFFVPALLMGLFAGQGQVFKGHGKAEQPCGKNKSGKPEGLVQKLWTCSKQKGCKKGREEKSLFIG